MPLQRLQPAAQQQDSIHAPPHKLLGAFSALGPADNMQSLSQLQMQLTLTYLEQKPAAMQQSKSGAAAAVPGQHSSSRSISTSARCCWGWLQA